MSEVEKVTPSQSEGVFKGGTRVTVAEGLKVSFFRVEGLVGGGVIIVRFFGGREGGGLRIEWGWSFGVRVGEGGWGRFWGMDWLEVVLGGSGR